ncbi:MAG: M48 family metalloprotease [Planctomycetes bacterium]|nr:M48 family metalloprotease [Planctomycetota bacterium]MCB9916829.1 M48 family metalloprotease [Planctomycetota bacterium]
MVGCALLVLAPEVLGPRAPQAADDALPAFSLSIAIFFSVYGIFLALDTAARKTRSARLGSFLRRLLALRSLLPIVLWALLLGVWRWDTWVEFRFVRHGMTVQSLMLLLPFVTYEILSVLGEVMLRGRIGRTAEYLRSTIFIAPMLFFLTALFDVASSFETTRVLLQEFTIARYALWVLGFGALFLAFPLWFAFVFGAKPLQPESLRDELRRIAENDRLRVHRILELPTRGRTLNATLVGPFAWTRCVVFTDLMLARFGVDELRGVFAHEIGHARGRHVLRSIACFVLLPLVLAELAVRVLHSETEWSWALSVACAFSVMAVPFFWFRRRFEHEADLHGAAILGSARDMIGALDTVRVLAPRASKRGSLMHPSTDRRIALLQSSEEDQGMLRSWIRTSILAQGAMFFALGAACMAFVPYAVDDFEDDLPGYLLARGDPESAWNAFESRPSMDEKRRAHGLDEAMRANLIAYDGEDDVVVLAQRAVVRGQRAARDEDWKAVRGWFGLALRFGDADPLTSTVWRYLVAVDRGDDKTIEREALWIRSLSVPEDMRRPLGRLLALN